LAVNRLVVDALEEAKIPLVLLDRDISEFPRRSKFDLIGIDNFAAGYQLAQHLVNLGCKRISFLAKPNSAQTIDLRIAGWREAMIRTGLECGPNRVRIGDPEDTAFVRTLVKANDSEAVICANDFTAAALMRSLLDLGVRVPQDIRLAGFDDLKYATLLSVRLTTMHQPCRSIGAAAVQAMLRRIKDPQLPAQEILFAAELVVRESCGANLPQKRK
jgi:LacI family transcriptional regulator